MSAGKRRTAVRVQHHHLDTWKTQLDDLDQFLHIEVSQPAVEKQQLPIATFEVSPVSAPPCTS